MKCTKCGLTKPESEFYTKTGRQRRNSRCINCYREQQNAARKEFRKDPAYRRAEYVRDANTPRARASALYHDIKRRAKKRDLEFNLTKDWIEERISHCEVTALPLVLARDGSNKTHPFAPSVDRINPNEGYTKENCRVVCWMYNACRNYHDHTDVVRFAAAICAAEGRTGEIC